MARSSVIPIPAFMPQTKENFRAELDIDPQALVLGFHQRSTNEIYSDIPLKSFRNLSSDFPLHFVLMGGGDNYKSQAQDLGLTNVHFIPHSGEDHEISKFLNTLDIYSHGRRDGETFGTVLAEAMRHGLPVISHKSFSGANAQPETIGPSGYFAENIDSYTGHLMTMLSSRTLRKELSQAGLEHAQKFYDVEHCADMLLESYSKVAGGTAQNSSFGFQNPERVAPTYGITPIGVLMAGDITNQQSDASSVLSGKIHIQGTLQLLSEIFLDVEEYSILQLSSIESLIAPWLSPMDNLQKIYFVTPNDCVAQWVLLSAELGRWAARLELFAFKFTSQDKDQHNSVKSDETRSVIEFRRFEDLTRRRELETPPVTEFPSLIPKTSWPQIKLISFDRNLLFESLVKEVSELISLEIAVLLVRSVPNQKRMQSSQIELLSKTCKTHYHWFRVTKRNRLVQLSHLASMKFRHGDLLGIPNSQLASVDFDHLRASLELTRRDIRRRNIREFRYRNRKRLARLSLPMRRRLGIS